MNTATDTEWDENSELRVDGAYDEFHKARKNGATWDEAFQIAREAYGLSDREFDALLHRLH